MNIEIGNKRFEATYSGTKIYVGRPSPLGNPFAAKNSTVAAYRAQNDADAVELFRRYLWQQMNERNHSILSALDAILRAAETEKVVLLCWCVDRKGAGICHARTIKNAVEWLAANKPKNNKLLA